MKYKTKEDTLKEVARRDLITKELIDSELFTESEIGSPAMELFIKYWGKYDEWLIDYAEKFMNLFGFDIGMDNVIKIDKYFTDNEDKIGYWEILDLNVRDMKFMMLICELANVNINFSNWKEKYSDDSPSY